MGKRPHEIYIDKGHLHFRKTAKPILQTVQSTGFQIHVYKDLFPRQSPVCHFLRRFGITLTEPMFASVIQRKNNKILRAGYMQPTIKDAVQFALNREKALAPIYPKTMHPNMERKGRKYGLDEVLDYVLFERKKNRKASQDRDYDGDPINMASERYQCFAMKGTKCVSCGLEGEYFTKEKSPNSLRYHFNLYAMKDGDEILFTKDHILPSGKGGSNKLANFQTMCKTCNERKSDKISLVI